VVSAEKMLVRIWERARELAERGTPVPTGSPVLDSFLEGGTPDISGGLGRFCLLDDCDVMMGIKRWIVHPDPVLSLLSQNLLHRRLLKVRLQATPFDESYVEGCRRKVAASLDIPVTDARYLVFTGEAANTTYDLMDERINILFRDGSVKDISQVDNALIRQTLTSTVKKFYICYLNI
jgi:hypothetical protein